MCWHFAGAKATAVGALSMCSMKGSMAAVVLDILPMVYMKCLVFILSYLLLLNTNWVLGLLFLGCVVLLCCVAVLHRHQEGEKRETSVKARI